MNFQDKRLSSQITPIHPAAPKIIKLLVKYSGGIIKNQRQAEMALFGFIVLSAIFSFLMFTNSPGQNLQSPIIGPKVENAGSPGEIINP